MAGAGLTPLAATLTITDVMRFSRAMLALVLAISFVMHANVSCRAAQMSRADAAQSPGGSCHHSSPASHRRPCCGGVACVSALQFRHDAFAVAPAIASASPQSPAPMGWLALATRKVLALAEVISPPKHVIRVIELRTLLL
jgi:hypothetical protein